RALCLRHFPPLAPVPLDRLRQAACGPAQPAATALTQIREDTPALRRAPQMHVGRLPSHHPQQPVLVTAARQARELDAAAVGGEAPDEPLTVQAEAGIGPPQRPADDLAIPWRAQPDSLRP